MENVRIVHVFVATLSQCLKYLPEHHKLWLLGTCMHLCFQRNILLKLPYLLSSLVLPDCFFHLSLCSHKDKWKKQFGNARLFVNYYRDYY